MEIVKKGEIITRIFNTFDSSGALADYDKDTNGGFYAVDQSGVASAVLVTDANISTGVHRITIDTDELTEGKSYRLMADNGVEVDGTSIDGMIFGEPFAVSPYGIVDDLLEADVVVEQESGAGDMSLVYYKRGTQEALMTKQLKDLNGNPITSISTFLAQKVQE